MKDKEYIDALKRINEQIGKYLENWFTPLNPRQHLFELIGRRNKLTFSNNRKEDVKRLKKSGDVYKLLYVWNLKDLLSKKER